VPALPPGYVDRAAELAGYGEALLGVGSGAVGLAGDTPALGLSGQGGIGKSVLAAALARDERVRTHFPDGVFWVPVGEQADLVGTQLDLLARLGDRDAVVRSVGSGRRLLAQALADRQVLLVVDDVWSTPAAAAFRVTGPSGRVLYTSRDRRVLAAVDARVETVEVLAEPAARALLAGLSGTPSGRLPVEVDRVLAATRRVALGLALVAAAVRGGAGWVQVADDLDRAGETFLNHPYANTFKALQVATAALDPELATAYLSLAVYPADTRVPVTAVTRYWRQLRAIPAHRTGADLQALADRELLGLDAGEVAFHDLQYDYLLLQVDDLPLRHADLLAAYRALLPDRGRDEWWRLPAGEPYIWDHLLHHLHGAGERAATVATATDLAYLANRVFLAGPYAAETDLTAAGRVDPERAEVGWLRDRFAQSAHLLTGLPAPADVAATVASRLRDAPAEVDRTRLLPLLRPPVPATGVGAGLATRRAASRADRPHRLGARGGVRPGRPAAGQRRRRRDGAAVGPGHRYCADRTRHRRAHHRPGLGSTRHRRRQRLRHVPAPRRHQRCPRPGGLVWTGDAVAGCLASNVARLRRCRDAGLLPAGECGGVGDVLGAQLAVDGIEGQTGDELGGHQLHRGQPATHLILGRERERGLPEHEHRPAVGTVHQAGRRGNRGGAGWRTRPTLPPPKHRTTVPVVIAGRWRITALRHAKSPAQKASPAQPDTSMSGVLGPGEVLGPGTSQGPAGTARAAAAATPLRPCSSG